MATCNIFILIYCSGSTPFRTSSCRILPTAAKPGYNIAMWPTRSIDFALNFMAEKNGSMATLLFVGGSHILSELKANCPKLNAYYRFITDTYYENVSTASAERIRRLDAGKMGKAYNIIKYLVLQSTIISKIGRISDNALNFLRVPKKSFERPKFTLSV